MEPFTEFEAFGGIDGHHGVGEAGGELVIHGLTQSGGQALDAALHECAHAVALARGSARAERLRRDGNAVGAQDQFGDGARHHPAGSLSRRSTAHLLIVAETVLLKVGIRNMRRLDNVSVALVYLNILIRYLETYGLACGDMVFVYSRQENDRVFLAALGTLGVSIGCAAGHLVLNEIQVDECALGAAFDDAF